MATTKKTAKKEVDARDVLDSGTGNELTAIAVKSLTNIEEKLEAVDWKLWEIYNIVKNYVESNPEGVSSPPVSQPQASAADIASEIAKALGGTQEPEPKKSVVGKLFGK
jgi:predicted nicotinamide N-methyase